MSRHHKGAYMDLLMAQFNNGHMTLQEIKTLLGKEDEILWEEILSKKFIQDQEGKFFNEKLEKEIIKRKRFTESRTNNLKGSPSDMSSHTASHMRDHMENENEIENGNEKKEGAGREKQNEFSDEVKDLYKSVVAFFDEKTRPKTQVQVNGWHDTLDKCIRIDGYTAGQIRDIVKLMRMDDFWRSNFMSIMKLRQLNKEKVKYIDVFAAKLSSKPKKPFGIPPAERDYTVPQSTF